VAVTVPAEKFPAESLLTSVLAVLSPVPALILASSLPKAPRIVSEDDKAPAVPVAKLVRALPVTVVAASVVLIPIEVTSPVRLPVKAPAVVAVVALPERAAEIVPAEKLPEASRATILLAVLTLVAEFAAKTAVLILAALEPPTLFTVAEALPEPEAATSPVRAVR
jgi:hypothetical protein